MEKYVEFVGKLLPAGTDIKQRGKRALLCCGCRVLDLLEKGYAVSLDDVVWEYALYARCGVPEVWEDMRAALGGDGVALYFGMLINEWRET